MVKQRGCIYRLTNMVNGKVYIGKTIRYKKRLQAHKKRKLKTYISRAIQKYGWENFKKEKIIDDVPEEDLSNLEVFYIEVENTMTPFGYNLTKGGEGLSGYKHTEEAIRKMHNGKYGCVSFDITYKKWTARGPSPEGKYIGSYFMKEKADEALKRYNESGKRMDSDRTHRKGGTGGIRKRGRRYYATITNNKRSYIGFYETKEKAEEALKRYFETGECMESDRTLRNRGTGTIRKKSNRYSARLTINKKTHCIGIYDTKEKAEEALKHYIETGECMESDRTRRKGGTGSIRKSSNGKRYEAHIKIKGKKRGKTFHTVEQCEEWINSIKNKV